jgi:hypothetical protein
MTNKLTNTGSLDCCSRTLEGAGSFELAPNPAGKTDRSSVVSNWLELVQFNERAQHVSAQCSQSYWQLFSREGCDCASAGSAMPLDSARRKSKVANGSMHEFASSIVYLFILSMPVKSLSAAAPKPTSILPGCGSGLPVVFRFHYKPDLPGEG